MLERLTTMHQDIQNAASRCENLGSTDNLDESDLPENTPIHKLATQVSKDLQQATEQVSFCNVLSGQGLTDSTAATKLKKKYKTNSTCKHKANTNSIVNTWLLFLSCSIMQ